MIYRFVIVTFALAASAASAAPPMVPGADRLGDDAAVLRGLVLLGELNCASCHDAGEKKSLIDTKAAPDLSQVGSRVDSEYLRRFIANPHTVKPGTTMPDVLAGPGMTRGKREDAAESLTHFLKSLSPAPFEPTAVDAKAVKRGETLFNSVGCTACHNPRLRDGRESRKNGSVPMGAIHEKYSTKSLAAFLVNPLKARPSGRMPGMNLSGWEAHDIAQYLMQRRVDRTAKPFNLDPDRLRAGKRYFSQFGCANCHKLDAAPPNKAHQPLAELNASAGCLAGRSGPSFDLSQSQRDSIAAALAAESIKLTPAQRIDHTLLTHNCVACHERGELGGVTPERDAFFKTGDPNLGPQGRIPPPLTDIGAKLNRKSLDTVMRTGEKVRPYLTTRMPVFGSDNVGHLVDAFIAADSIDPAPKVEPGDAKETIKIGRELVGNKGLNCIACHTFKGKRATEMAGIDLTETATRLNRDWFYAYLVSPQRFHPQTIMPTFWPGGKSVRPKILDGHTDKQIDAIWTYLSEGPNAPDPPGLIRESLELTVGDEAVMLRRQYHGVGKRGIGVGYPNKLNLVFDAEQIRLAHIWKNRFIDAGGVWRGQGSGSPGIIGDARLAMPQGSAFAPDADLEKFTDKPARDLGIRFKGYELDAKRRPTFFYVIGKIKVSDTFIDVSAEGDRPAYFKRTIVFDAPGDAESIAMRLAEGKTITAGDNGTFLIDKLTIKASGLGATKIVKLEKTQQLRAIVPLNPLLGKTVVIEYHW